MIIAYEYPPNIEEIKRVLEPRVGAIFTYGEVIYSPDSKFLTEDLVAHESTHMLQQQEIGGVDIWWDKYLNDPEFRLEEELNAYHNQYEFFKTKVKDRNQRAIFLHKLAVDMASPMYGNVISYDEAVERIKNEG